MRWRWYHKAAHLADMTDCGRCLSFHSDTIFAEALSVGTGRPFDIYLTSKCLLSCSLLYLPLCSCAQNVTSCYTMTDTAPILSLLIFILVDGFFFFFLAVVVVTWANQLYIKAQSHFQCFTPSPCFLNAPILIKTETKGIAVKIPPLWNGKALEEIPRWLVRK